MSGIEVYRGELLESSHQVHVAVCNTNGDLLHYYGDSNRLTFARSSMKPFQAIPVIESGAMAAYQLTKKELALFCASHNGEAIHREMVEQVLNKIGLTEEHLQCGTHIPRDMKSYEQLLRSGGELTSLYSNCSGKHSGMLAGALKFGYELTNYRDVDHPYQQHIIDVIADVSSYQRAKIRTSVDGCGVPVHRLPLGHLATAFARLAKPTAWPGGSSGRKEALNTIADAMVTYPEMVAGTDRFDTDLMKVFKGRIVAKVGAEGIYCFGDRETGIGAALKVEDGNERATNVAAMEIIEQLQIGNVDTRSKLNDYHYAPVLNARQEKIGEIRPAFQLTTVSKP
ncbi:asparaginase [Aquibacillus salsiterrae]|uniref:Asparaginase n=1 Tax=Aquibacillus salsiterrae TaxID=2950439 RepID=A0A9X4AGB4_9BACI|nr:asparaginase [Aquibacillus salsiterrae]MDC3416918.1 asparaginase [Aquibacillus salsiterrae]